MAEEREEMRERFCVSIARVEDGGRSYRLVERDKK